VSSENIEIVRRHYRAWSEGDLDEVIGAFAEDVEWHGHPRLPEPGPYLSRDEVSRWMSQFREAWGELSAEPVELVDAGDGVIALVHMSGRGRGSGVEVRGGVDVHVIRLRDGAVSYFRIYPGDFLHDHPELSETEFELLILRVQEGLGVPEIARRLGIPQSEAEAMLEHARAVLRSLSESDQLG
jgi:ketosteroid isomerase-like protein